MSTLHLQLFSTFQLSLDREPLTGLHQARLQSLLAYLALHRHAPQTRQHLAFLFWPDSSETQAYSNLRKLLTMLRDILPNAQHFLEIDAKTVRLRPDGDFTLDVADFERHVAEAEYAQQQDDMTRAYTHLETAIGLYMGDLLPECYEDWIVPERERLREHFLEASARLSDGSEQARNYPAAIRLAKRLLQSDPLHEETYRRLMRLHALNGDRAAALHLFHTCAATLQRELGVAPGPLLQEAYAHLMQLETVPQVPRQGKRDTMVGRQVEWQHLISAWNRAAQGHPHFVLIGGEPGIGKTRLVEELAQWVGQQGFAVATTRAYAAEGDLAYEPISAWVRSRALQQSLANLEDMWLAEIARLVPEVRAQRPNLPAPEALTESWQRHRFFEALARAFLAVPKPLLLVLDNVQWCDRETLEWLHYLLRFGLQSRLMVVGTARLGEVGADHPLRALLAELRQAGQVTQFELEPLNAHKTMQLAQQIANRALEPAQETMIYRVTEGNPLLVQEMFRAETLGAASGLSFLGAPLALAQELPPPKMQSIIEARLARLSAEAHNLAVLAATIGRSFTFSLLRQATGKDEDQLVVALDELWQRRMIREQGIESYDFSHDRIREGIYASISPMRQRRLHAQVAQALEELHAAELSMASARIAAHYRQAGDVAKAAAYYYRAAYEMHFGFAHEETLTHLAQGLTMLQGQPRSKENIGLEIAMLLARGRILTARDGWGGSGAIEAFERAHQLCLETNNLTQQLRVQDYLQIAYGENGNLSRALGLAHSNLRLATELSNSAEIEGAHGGLGFLLWCAGEFVLAREHLEQAATLAAARPEAQTNAYQRFTYAGAFPYVHVLWSLGYAETAHRYLLEVLAAQEPHVGPFDRMTGYEFCIMFHHARREFAQMQVFAAKMLALTVTYEYTIYQKLSEIYVAAAAAALRQPHTQITLLRQNLETVTATGTRMHLPFCLCLLAEIDVQAGRVTEAQALVDEALTTIAATGEHLWEAATHRLHGELRARQGAGDEAESSYLKSLAVARNQQAKSLELRAAVNLCRLWQVQGKRKAASELLFPLYNWFTEGFDTLTLQEAQMLLTTLLPV